MAWARWSCRPRSCRPGCQEFVLARKRTRLSSKAPMITHQSRSCTRKCVLALAHSYEECAPQSEPRDRARPGEAARGPRGHALISPRLPQGALEASRVPVLIWPAEPAPARAAEPWAGPCILASHASNELSTEVPLDGVAGFAAPCGDIFAMP